MQSVALMMAVMTGIALAQVPWEFLAPQTEIKGAAVPIFLGNDSSPAAVLRIDRIHTDYQRRGFFRIGLLPMAVADGLRIEFRQPGKLAEALSRLHGCLAPENARRAVELRRVTFICPAVSTHCVCAGRARLAGDRRWQLLDGVTVWGANEPISAPAAILYVAGPQAGQLDFESSAAQPLTVNLFTLLERGRSRPQVQSELEAADVTFSALKVANESEVITPRPDGGRERPRSDASSLLQFAQSPR